jgi:hypothetical protein
MLTEHRSGDVSTSQCGCVPERKSRRHQLASCSAGRTGQPHRAGSLHETVNLHGRPHGGTFAAQPASLAHSRLASGSNSVQQIKNRAQNKSISLHNVLQQTSSDFTAASSLNRTHSEGDRKPRDTPDISEGEASRPRACRENLDAPTGQLASQLASQPCRRASVLRV